MTYGTADRIKEETTMRAINEWIPNRLHCSDCRHAVVGGVWPSPIARCELGHGKRANIQLAALLRSHGPGFMAAKECPDFTSMNDQGVR